ncbi:MAG: YceH family protein [Terriglobales bacterium]
MDAGWTLNGNEARVLGALIEKQITTPEYYPLTLNALVNACNQKSNRDPVTTLEEDDVRLALRNLQDKGLAAVVHEGRVLKFEHRLQEALNLSRGQTALLCVLLLRGAQTPGELRGRSERLHAFAELDEISDVLRQLIDHDPPLTAMLARQPGTKEARYVHLLSPVPEAGVAGSAVAADPVAAPEWERRMERLEAEVASLREAVRELRGGD